MLKLNIEDFIYEVKEELNCYEELGEEKINDWEKGFRKWYADGRKKKRIRGEGENTAYMIEDESEIFDIADEYLNAVEENKVAEYWKKFN